MAEKRLKGGEFLIKETDPTTVFIPEEWDEEQKMIIQTCEDFLEQEVYPNLDRIDSMEKGLMPEIMTKAGELGLLGISIPEDLGGFGKDFKTSMLSAEATGPGHSFSVAISAHTGIGTLPILYYGNDEQRQKYIPKLASGEWKGCYCLTEPGAGSDANSGKTKAKLSADGKHYILNGQKMWITNGGFADIYTVFAKIDDADNLSAFIVERGFEGLSLNPEEKKMGIKGSSTVQVFLNDCKVPVENLLSERGSGFKIALNILNIGRIKLATAANGASKRVSDFSIQYANERIQFGRPISKYGAIKYKIAQQAIRIFATDSASYRAGHDIDQSSAENQADGMDKFGAILKGVEQYATEAAILKVYGSETLDYVTDEGVQIYGGMGYSAEAPMERAYRDSRINRIFEGTNEINRMLIVDMLLKRAMKGEIDLLTHAKKVGDELMSTPEMPAMSDDPFAKEMNIIANFKKAVLMVAGAAAQKFMMELAKQQEILMNIADMVIETYVAESTLLRVRKLMVTKSEAEIAGQINMTRCLIYDACDTINKAGKDAINSFAEGDQHKGMMMGIKRFTKHHDFNPVEARRIVADQLISEGRYCY